MVKCTKCGCRINLFTNKGYNIKGNLLCGGCWNELGKNEKEVMMSIKTKEDYDKLKSEFKNKLSVLDTQDITNQKKADKPDLYKKKKMKISITAEQLMELRWIIVILKVDCPKEFKKYFLKELKKIKKQFEKNGFECSIKKGKIKKMVKFELFTTISPHFFIINCNEIKRFNTLILNNLDTQIKTKDTKVEILYGQPVSAFKMLKRLNLGFAENLNDCFNKKELLTKEDLTEEDYVELFSIPDFEKLLNS